MVLAVCFDLDGTLFDDRQYVRAGLIRAADLLDDREDIDVAENLLEAYFQREIRDQTFDVVLSEMGISRDIVPELVAAYHDNDSDLFPYPGAIDMLETLDDDYRLGLITGGTNGRGKLKRLNIKDYFDEIIVTAEHDVTKTDPEPFENILAALNTPPECAVYVGDRPELDFHQPNRIGMYTIRVRKGQYAAAQANDDTCPDTTVESLSALPEAIRAFDYREKGTT